MVINSFSDIANNCYIFNFKREAGEPDFNPIYEGDVKIWVASEGVIIKGKKICGHVGNSLFKVGGTSVNSPLAICRTMLCKWEDIEIYNKRERRRKIRTNPKSGITLYPNTTYSIDRGIHVVECHIHRAEKYRDHIFKMSGEGVNKEVLADLVDHGPYYKDGKDMFFLMRGTKTRSYFFRKIMSVTEFEKVTLREKKKEVKSFNVFRL